MRRKDRPPRGYGKPDLLTPTPMKQTDDALRSSLTVSKEEIERRESEDDTDDDDQLREPTI